jgi:hypothetical protein
MKYGLFFEVGFDAIKQLSHAHIIVAKLCNYKYCGDYYFIRAQSKFTDRNKITVLL